MEQMEKCKLCPRKCGVNRRVTAGACGQSDQIWVARTALHMWEEPCISGTEGSGAVFFSGCPLGCVYCQNYQISAKNVGKHLTIEELAGRFLDLQRQGANNINLVTAGHFVPQVIRALECAKRQGLSLPVVYNSSAYESVDTLKMLEGYVDIYLPDLKYLDADRAARYSKAADYPETAKRAIAEMVRQCPEALFEQRTYPPLQMGNTGGDGCKEGTAHKDAPQEMMIMKKGVIVRHLVLPGGVEAAKRVIRYLAQTYKDQIFVSILNQYTPLPHAAGCPELMRRLTKREYDRVVDYAIELGIENGFIQEADTAKESFIPEFFGDEDGKS